MKLWTLILIAPLLMGCGAITIKTSGFDPAIATKIHEALDGARKLCSNGVASEERTMRAEAHNANRDRYYRPIIQDRKELTVSETRQTIVCK